MTHYEVLGIPADSEFKAIKKAYYKRAKECHPDLHANRKDKEEEFKLVVEAFNCLSDPAKRQEYDRRLQTASQPDGPTAAATDAAVPESIMDSPADDDLEELITGNNIPLNTNLATLFLDLARTDVFINFREGKNLFFQHRFRAARNFFIQAVEHSPANIVYRCYLARVCVMLGDFDRGRKEYQSALDLGQMRTPPQRLRRLRRELDLLNKNHRPWWQRLFNIMPSATRELGEDAAEAMIEEANRSIARITAARDEKKKQKELQAPRKLLNK